MYEDLFWHGKTLNFTFHALQELDESGKNSDRVLEILTYGEHKKESKEKYIAKLRLPNKEIEAVYIERDEDILIIHLRI